jgi:hypothetical protein
MKTFLFAFLTLFLTGCATSSEQLYYDTIKSVSKDNTMSQTACWAAISDIAKGGDNSAKVGAISLAEKCKNESLKVEGPKRGLF